MLSRGTLSPPTDLAEQVLAISRSKGPGDGDRGPVWPREDPGSGDGTLAAAPPPQLSLHGPLNPPTFPYKQAKTPPSASYFMVC